jgi:extracellular factor (EF) 3-hydroxypalmitic acid methyl ester biosynthesis protein
LAAGYPGDFETIEWLFDGRPRLASSNKYYWIEWYALNTPIAQQHRNKIAFQREKIFENITDGSRILSVGCGGALDMHDVAPAARELRCTLVDIDGDALELAKSRLVWAEEVNCIRGDVLHVLKRLERGYDRIVFGGLFDYLSDRAVTLSLRLASQLASSSGCKIIFTNIRSPGPFNSWIETMARWPLITRSEDDIREILDDSGIGTGALLMKRDGTGLSLLCEVDVS